MNYWLDLFTGTTWQEFQDAGAKVSGFRDHNWKRAQNIKPGDILLCYMVGVKRWVGLLEVTSDRFRDETQIWGDELFPVRFRVKPLVMLPPEHGVPMEEFKGKLSFFDNATMPGRWSGAVRSSPTKYKARDGEIIMAAIQAAKADPVVRPVDPKKLKRSPNLYKLTGFSRVDALLIPTSPVQAFRIGELIDDPLKMKLLVQITQEARDLLDAGPANWPDHQQQLASWLVNEDLLDALKGYKASLPKRTLAREAIRSWHDRDLVGTLKRIAVARLAGENRATVLELVRV